MLHTFANMQQLWHNHYTSKFSCDYSNLKKKNTHTFVLVVNLNLSFYLVAGLLDILVSVV